MSGLGAVVLALLTTISVGEYDRYGGDRRVTAPATGFFRCELRGGRWWLITPEGHGFLSIGVSSLRPQGDHCPRLGYAPYARTVAAKYTDHAAWARATLDRLRAWGFNTVAGWSAEELFVGQLPSTTVLGISGAEWRTGAFPDVFDSAWAAGVPERARERCAPRRDDPWLLGWYLDNELSWSPDWRDPRPLLDRYLNLPTGSPGRLAALNLLRERHGSIAAFNLAWRCALTNWEALAEAETFRGPGLRDPGAEADRDAFLERVAERYFQVTCEAVRAADPNHLILGCRFVAVLAPPTVVRVAGRWCDVVSVQPYELEPRARSLLALLPPAVPLDDGLRAFAELSGRPVLVTEFGFRARDAGLPNTRPPLMLVLDTQADRAERYRATVSDWMSRPWVLGCHWFEYVDQPAEGRFDGENSNWGLVNVDDEPYEALVSVMAEVNRTIYDLHLAAGE